MTHSGHQRQIAGLFLLFALSGFCGLIYESIWTHYLKLILGHAAYAQTLVLSIFMGGLAIGSALTASNRYSITTPLRFYAIVEFVIGLLAIGFHAIFVSAEVFLHEAMIPAIDTVAVIEILRWGLAALLILPQSILLGTTFPLMGMAVVRLDSRHAGSSLGLLYFSNSLGAAAGVLCSAFLLIALVGLPGTILTAGVLNIVIAVIAWAFSKFEIEQPLPAVRAPQPAPRDDRTITRLFLAIALFTGLASFFYEIAWIRMLSLVLGSSMQAFELMLSAFILGLALGGLWVRKRIDSTPNPALFLGKVQLLMGVFAVATLPLYNQMFDFMAFLVQSLAKNGGGYLLFNLGSHLIAMLIMLPATFMAGMTLPLITFSLLKWKQGESSIGRVYAFNTVGAIAGILLAVHLGMPLIGTKGLIFAGALIDGALGCYLILQFMEGQAPSARLKFAGAVGLVLIVLIPLTTQFELRALSSGVFRYGENFSENETVVFYRNGKTASISVVEIGEGVKSIATNGKPDAAIYSRDMDYGSDEITMTMLAALPLAIHPEARSLANIGLGSGLTTHTLLLSPQLERVDTIEIEPAVVEAIQEFGSDTELALLDPRSNIVIDDAKAFFSRNKSRYDIIVSEPSNPWVAGVGNLFTTEFYGHIRRYLEEDGILVQWLHLYESNLNLVASVFNAMAPHFDDYMVYNSTDDDIIIVAGNGRDLRLLDDRIFSIDGFREKLDRVHLADVDDMRGRLIGNKRLLQPFFSGTEINANSDYFPTLELHATRSRYLGESATELTELHLADFPPAHFLIPIVDNEAEGLYFMGDAMKQLARRIAAQLLQLEPQPRFDASLDTNLNLDLQEKVAVVKALLENCAPLENQQQLFGNSLHTIAINTLPFIDTPGMRAFWRQLGSHPCLQAWPEEIGDWMRLYAAIGSGELEETVILARRLINWNSFTPPPQSDFLFGATLNALIRLERYQEAQDFALEAVLRTRSQMRYPLYLRMLFAQLGVTEY